MAAEGVYWKPEQLKTHLQVFPQGQIIAEYNGKIVGSCSSLIIQQKSLVKSSKSFPTILTFYIDSLTLNYI
jgi:hypothetical protein